MRSAYRCVSVLNVPNLQKFHSSHLFCFETSEPFLISCVSTRNVLVFRIKKCPFELGTSVSFCVSFWDASSIFVFYFETLVLTKILRWYISFWWLKKNLPTVIQFHRLCTFLHLYETSGTSVKISHVVIMTPNFGWRHEARCIVHSLEKYHRVKRNIGTLENWEPPHMCVRDATMDFSFIIHYWDSVVIHHYLINLSSSQKIWNSQFALETIRVLCLPRFEILSNTDTLMELVKYSVFSSPAHI